MRRAGDYRVARHAVRRKLNLLVSERSLLVASQRRLLRRQWLARRFTQRNETTPPPPDAREPSARRRHEAGGRFVQSVAPALRCVNIVRRCRNVARRRSARSAPIDAPRRSLCPRWSATGGGAPLAPPVEPRARRKRINSRARSATRVLPEVRDHVEEGISHFTRGFQGVTMKTIGPERPTARQKVVHVAGHADGDAADPAREARNSCRQVSEFRREVDDSEPRTLAMRNAS